jgi:hypothetical protein
MVRFSTVSVPIPDAVTAKTPGLLEQLGNFAWTLTILSGLLFYFGYERLNSYYAEFKVPLWLLDLPAYMYPMYAQKAISIVLLVTYAAARLFVPSLKD